MSTEKDNYELDTTKAVSSLSALSEAFHTLEKDVEETEKKHMSLADTLKVDVAKSIATVEVAAELLKEAFHAIIEVIKEGIEEWEQTTIAVNRLDFAMEKAGDGSGFYRARLEEQRKEVEKLTGMTEAQVAGMQNLALTMGVGAGEVQRFVEVSIRLSQSLGIDATTAVRTLARAHSEGKEELKRYGITLSDTATEAQGFDKVLEEVEKRTSDISQTMPEFTRFTNENAAAWNDVKKAVGGALADLWVFLNQDVIARRKAQQAIDDQRKALAGAGASAGHAALKVDVGDVTEDKEYEERAKKYEAWLAQSKKLAWEAVNEYDKAEQEKTKKTRERIEKVEDWETLGAQNDANVMAATLKDVAHVNEERLKLEEDVLKKQEDAHVASLQKREEKEKQFWESMKSMAQNYTTQLLDVGANYLEQEIQSNTQFNHQMFDLAVQRETVGMSEYDATAKRLAMEEDLRQSKIASLEKELAATLASIAKDAAIKALFETATGVALAIEDEAGAEQAFIAAGLFAGVAIAAGGAAYGLSSSRGMTSDESQRLKDTRKANADAASRTAQQTAQRGSGETGSQITVVYMGIAGVSELEQAKELDRLRREYQATLTGSK